MFVSYGEMYREKQQVDNWDQEVCSDRGKFTKTTEFQYWTFCTEMLHLQSGIRINSSSKTHTRTKYTEERQQRPTKFVFPFYFFSEQELKNERRKKKTDSENVHVCLALMKNTCELTKDQKFVKKCFLLACSLAASHTHWPSACPSVYKPFCGLEHCVPFHVKRTQQMCK